MICLFYFVSLVAYNGITQFDMGILILGITNKSLSRSTENYYEYNFLF